jgi:hypothetical protein
MDMYTNLMIVIYNAIFSFTLKNALAKYAGVAVVCRIGGAILRLQNSQLQHQPGWSVFQTGI